MDTSTAIAAAVDTLGRRVVAPRRHRTIEEKVRIVAESRLPGASVAEVARRHAVNANQVFGWRRLADQGLLGGHTRRGRVKVLAVQVSEEQDAASAVKSAGADAVMAPREGRIEITLTDGVRIALSGVVTSEQLAQVLRVLRR